MFGRKRGRALAVADLAMLCRTDKRVEPLTIVTRAFRFWTAQDP